MFMKSRRRDHPVGEEAKKFITGKEARVLAEEAGIKVTMMTIYSWVDKNPEIGFQPGGPGCRYYIHKDKFMRLLNAAHGQNNKNSSK